MINAVFPHQPSILHEKSPFNRRVSCITNLTVSLHLTPLAGMCYSDESYAEALKSSKHVLQIATLSVSRVFLFKEQTYRGRCLVAYKSHVNDLFELSDEERNAFMADVTHATRAMDKTFHPTKINYGAYSDKLSHLHFHLAPKYEGGPDFGGVFVMNPQKVYLTNSEYHEMINAMKANLLM